MWYNYSMKILDDIIDKRISQHISRIIDSIIELDPDKSYILVIPESIPAEMLNEFEEINTNVNILVIRADDVKLITLS